MTERALQPGQAVRPERPASSTQPPRPAAVPRRRVLFGLLDANGWTWAGLKSVFWFLVIIMLLGYIPDRAYYFTVFSTIDVGIMAWSPVNICPSTNQSLPCPAPDGAILPWQPAQSNQLRLPAPRTNAAAVQSGETILLVGGSDGSKAQSSVYSTSVTTDGNLTGWQQGPALPAPRSHATAAYLAGNIYVIGGLDENGAATDTVFVGAPDPKTSQVDKWEAKDALKLPAARADATVVVASDGLYVIGGSDGKAPTSTVWKSTLDTSGNLGAWTPDGSMGDKNNQYARSGAAGILEGTSLYIYGGSDAKGPTAQVLRGIVNADKSGKTSIDAWQTATNSSANLPAPRANGAAFTSNGALYLVGGSPDGKRAANEVYWAVPDTNGGIPAWNHLAQTDLPSAGLQGAAVLPAAGHAFLFGGTPGGASAPTASVERSDLAPAPPLFQLGLFGATIPALGIQKEIGQQLGYLAAAGVGTVNFIILVLIGLAYAHPERTRELFDGLRRRRAGR